MYYTVIHACMNAFKPTKVFYVYIYMWIYTCVHTYTYAYVVCVQHTIFSICRIMACWERTYIYMHAYIHTYIHIHKRIYVYGAYTHMNIIKKTISDVDIDIDLKTQI